MEARPSLRYATPMRPDRLNPLFTEVAALKGVGAGLARPLERLGLTRVRDLAYHLPDRFISRQRVANLDEATVGAQIIVALTPVEVRASGSGRAPLRVMAATAVGKSGCRFRPTAPAIAAPSPEVS